MGRGCLVPAFWRPACATGCVSIESMGLLLRVQLSNPASAAGLVMTNHTRYAVPWQPIWPSITAEADATVRSAFMKVYSSDCRLVIPDSSSQHAAACSAAWLPDMPTTHEKRSAL